MLSWNSKTSKLNLVIQSLSASILWCVNCDVAYLVENFNCSSGDPKLDVLIRHKQKNAKENMDFLEWIDFSQFDIIRYTGKEGSFSSIYSALWMEGPFWTGMKLQVYGP